MTGQRPVTIRRAAGAAALALAALVSACAVPAPEDAAGPGVQDVPPAAPSVAPRDAETIAGLDYYRRIQSNYLSQGLLRTDGGGADTPFDAGRLAESFLNIAFFDEFSDDGGKLVAGGGQQRLHRWSKPIRVKVEFGPTVPLDARRSDLAEIAAYLARLSDLTGLSIRIDRLAPNFLVLVENPAERRGAEPRIRTFAPSTSAAALGSALDLAPSIYCTVFGYTSGNSGEYDRALALVRGELPDLMRRACLHEEIAQGLGLINDDPHARPSIFNDNEEFALLTRQDELMLRILYDPRLRPGMTLDEARPIVQAIAAELLAGDS